MKNQKASELKKKIVDFHKDSRNTIKKMWDLKRESGTFEEESELILKSIAFVKKGYAIGDEIYELEKEGVNKGQIKQLFKKLLNTLNKIKGNDKKTTKFFENV
jgi:uncharacterized protein YjbK